MIRLFMNTSTLLTLDALQGMILFLSGIDFSAGYTGAVVVHTTSTKQILKEVYINQRAKRGKV